jgi:uncharacterized protein involved in exopolysaccharide biosynthesis
MNKKEQSAFDDLARKVADLEEQIADVTGEKDQLQKQLDEALVSPDEAINSAMEQLKSENADLKEEAKDLNVKVEGLESEINTLEGVIEEQADQLAKGGSGTEKKADLPVVEFAGKKYQFLRKGFRLLGDPTWYSSVEAANWNDGKSDGLVKRILAIDGQHILQELA